MARPQKKGLDYFPMDVDADTDDKIEYVTAKHGFQAFGIYIKLLMSIYKSGYYLKFEEIQHFVYAKRTDTEIEKFKAIVAEFLNVGLFDKTLYEKAHVLTSASIQRRYLAATERRKDDEINEYSLLGDNAGFLQGYCQHDVGFLQHDVDIMTQNVSNNPQSKVKESKRESKEKEKEKKDNESASHSLTHAREEHEPVDNPEKTVETPGGSEKTVETPISRRFAEFWAAYPKKQGKGAAEKAYKRIKPTAQMHETMIRAVRAAALSRQWQEENGRFIPNPATWLNQKRWEDEPPDEISAPVFNPQAEMARRAIAILESQRGGDTS